MKKMPKINFRFNENFVQKLWNKIPEKISKLNIRYKKTLFGGVRFDDNKLNSVYVYTDHKEFNLFKFNYENDEFVFTGMYVVPSDLKKAKESWYEVRYDSDLNVDSIYSSNLDENGDLNITKVSEKSKKIEVLYDFPDETKEFNEFLDLMIEKEMIINHYIPNKHFNYFTKFDEKVIYLHIRAYEGNIL